ncbi:MAG: Lyase-like protein [Nitrospinae bacterium]|nr:Lyase-like protein [Nitrospinota bacterium]
MLNKLMAKRCVLLLVMGCFLSVWTTSFGEVILEYPTPTPDSSPADLAFDSQGNLWFTELNANRIGKLVPSQGKPLTQQGFTEYELPHPNSKPHYLTVARNGLVWFTEMGGNRIGSLDPKTGIIKEYEIPSPHSEPHQIVEGTDGSIWFLEFQTNKVGRLNPKTGEITEYPVGPGNPHALAVDGDKLWYTQGGMFWVNLFFNKLGYLNTKTGEVQEIAVPPEKSVPHGLTLSANGTVWFTQMFASKVAKLEHRNGKPHLVEYFLGKRRSPHDLQIDEKRGYVWFTAARPDAIGRLDLSQAEPGTSKGVKFYKLPDPHSHPTQIILDKDGNVWFTEMGMYFRGRYNNKIGMLIP